MWSKRTSGWRLVDWFFFIVVVFVVFALLTAALHGFAPTSGASQALHTAGINISHFLSWVAAFFTMLSSWFAQW
jgi:hypothetical protein